MSAVIGFVKKYMALIVLVVAALNLFVPQTGLWVQAAWVGPLLMVVLFGMGLTMGLDDFKAVFTSPKDVLVGCVAQYVVMPLLAFLIGHGLGLETELLAGLILVGTCPGGTASDVMTYLARGDVALSVSVTAVNTLLAPLLTPIVTLVYLGSTVDVDVVAMFLDIVKVVIAPIILGLVMRRLLGDDRADRVASFLPLVSVVAICLIIAAVVSHNSERIFAAGALIIAACVMLNLLGYAAGFAVAKLAHMTEPRCKAMSLEIGMQNSGLATTLAASVFPNLALATVPGAVFSVWHNISGAVLASFFRHMTERREAREARQA